MSVEILNGDCRTILSLVVPDESIQSCITSPPYFGLRDYGVEGQIGLEQSPDEYVAQLVDVFRHVRRALRPDGTLWLNLGDSYAGSGKGAWGVDDDVKKAAGTKERYRPRGVSTAAAAKNAVTKRAGQDRFYGLKAKDLIGIPWRVAFALQADGWYLRQDIIWHKPNPMPHPNTDRCVTAHEYIFLLSKSPRYYFDHEAIQEPAVEKAAGNKKREPAGARGVPGRDPGNPNDGVAGSVPWSGTMRNKRDVWTVTTKPFKGAHFATFPPDLIEPCVLAGSKPGDLVLDPFGGAGTTGLVARRHGRRAVLCELNEAYVAIAEERLRTSE